jgi:hypothetical protein
MASTYSNLKIELIGTGDQSGTWGTTTNINLGTAIEEAITGSADVTFASADVTLTLTNTNASQPARNLRLNLVGNVSTTQNLIVPAIEKQYIINNTLGSAITVKNATGTGVSVPAGKSIIVFNTGSNVVEVVTALASGTVIPIANGGTGSTSTTYCSLTTNVTGTLPIANGGTGASTFTSGDLLKGNTTGAIQTASAADIVGQIGSTAVTNATNATNATNITNAGGWNVTPSGTNLYFNYNGTNVGVLTSTGDFTVLGNVTAFGTV